MVSSYASETSILVLNSIYTKDFGAFVKTKVAERKVKIQQE